MTTSAVIFDFDGTLTRPYLNFDVIRAEIGIEEGPILEALDSMDETGRRRALAILDRFEQEAAENATLHEGAQTTLATLREQGVPIAILTRNVRRWVELVLDRFELVVDAIRTREDGVIKPSPRGLLYLCEQMDVSPQHSWMVGDHLFDIITGESAGARTVLVMNDPTTTNDALNEARRRADHAITSLPQLLPIVGSGRICC